LRAGRFAAKGGTMEDLGFKAMIGATIAVAAGVVGLVGWTIHHEIVEPDSGTITEMEYRPAYVTTQCTTSGKTTTCIPTTHPECYYVKYSPNPDEWGDACVAPTDWPRYHIGDHYP